MNGSELNLREIWAEIQAVGPHEYANITGPNGDARILTNSTHLMIEVTEAEHEAVIQIPLSVGDALLGTDSPNFDEIVEQLIALDEEYLVLVTGTQVNMKAWLEYSGFSMIK